MPRPAPILILLILGLSAGRASSGPDLADAGTVLAGGAAQPARPPGRVAAAADRAREWPFTWRGVTAFRLAELVARGRTAEVEAYLDWAASRQLTVVRVLAMAHHLFRLSPADGRAALPTVLGLAAARGLHVEIVALADTREIDVSLDEHVREIGAIAARYPNALIEIANEPGHPTQRADVHRPARLRALAALVPDGVPTALGSAEYGDGFASGDYVTVHVPRDPGDDGWGHVLRIADRAALVDRVRKPVVSDEPIGAGPRFVPGRRDNSPSRFAAAAVMTRFVGLHPTFHYEGGLQAAIPTALELVCFDAWMEGLEIAEHLPGSGGRFLAADRVGRLARVSGGRAAFGRVTDTEAWVLVVDPDRDVAVDWHPPWRAVADAQVPGARLFRGRREREPTTRRENEG